MIADGTASKTWSRVKERIGVALWTSFLAAAVETMVFFAFLDPLSLDHGRIIPPWLAQRSTAYAVGFFLFWAFAFAAAALTAYMLDTSRGVPTRFGGRPR